MVLTLSSTAFKEGDMIPVRHTCDGEGMSPPLTWVNVPEKAASLALIVDDPDSLAGTWVHWVMYNIPIRAGGVAENLPRLPHLTNGTKQGLNDAHHTGYVGPCPRSGAHRYHFKLYALDIKLELAHNAVKSEVVKAMQDHILEESCLTGSYQKKSM